MKEKIIQFGEGGFLRGFADWMLEQVNEQTDFGGKVVVVQPIERVCAMCFQRKIVHIPISAVGLRG